MISKKNRLRIKSVVAVLIVAIMSVCSIDLTYAEFIFEIPGSSTTVMYDVTYSQSSARSMLDMINEFRTGDDAWYWNKDNTAKTQAEGREELKYDKNLEQIAMQRAAEVAMSFSHTRPDGTQCFTAKSNNVSSYGENIAAGYSSAEKTFVQWQENDDDYSGQGHRRNMLGKSYNAVGIGHVIYKGRHFWVQEFGIVDNSDSLDAPDDSEKTVSVDVASSQVASHGDTECSVNKILIDKKDGIAQLPSLSNSSLTIKSQTYYSRLKDYDILPQWKVADKDIIKIEDNNVVALKDDGKTEIYTYVFGEKITIPVYIGSYMYEAMQEGNTELRCDEDGVWRCYNDGVFVPYFTGLIPNEYGWWYVENGCINFGYTGIKQNKDGWWKITNGAVDFTYTGLAANEYGWWYLENGAVNFDYTGIKSNENGWWKITNGAVDFTYTGLAANEYGWWYLENGSVNFNYTGIKPNEDGWWKITNGAVDFTYTGLAANEYGWWYLENGAVNFNYTGQVSNEYGTWNVVNGSVIF